MTEPLRITRVQLIPAPPDDIERGLLGWISLVLNDTLVLDSITLRRTVEGRLTLSYPARRGQYPYVRPVGDRARRGIERKVFAELGLGEDAA